MRELSVHKRRIYRRLRTSGLCCHVPSPTVSLSLDYVVSCGLQSVASHRLHAGFQRAIPRGFALAFGAWLSLLTLSPSRYSHRGFPPHKFAPTLGAHDQGRIGTRSGRLPEVAGLEGC